MLPAVLLDDEVLYLSVICVSDSLQGVEVGLDHRRHLWIAAALKPVEVQRNRDRAIEALEAKEASIVFGLLSKVGFESGSLLLLAAIRPLAQEAIASVKEDKLISLTHDFVFEASKASQPGI